MRNPDRMRDFLSVLKTMEGSEWNHETQMEYQTRLIQDRRFTPKTLELSPQQQELISDSNRSISLREAVEIFRDKEYVGTHMRGRTSASPLKKFGLATFEQRKIAISEFGNLFLHRVHDTPDYFLRMLLKWQIPNPDNKAQFKPGEHDIKPFIGTLHLIQRVNELEKSRGRTSKGISRREFCIFGPTLVHYENIAGYAEQIVDIRKEIEGLSRKEQDERFNLNARTFVGEFYNTDDELTIDKKLRTLRDYGDNAIRFFRMTRYIHIRGGGFYVDIEPYRTVQIDALLSTDTAKAIAFANRQEFLEYITNPTSPELPWETVESQIEILRGLEITISDYEGRLNSRRTEPVDASHLDDRSRRQRIELLTQRRRDLQDIERYLNAQKPESIQECIAVLGGIFGLNDRPIVLERTATLCLCALNDATSIRPQYPVGDDNEPTNTAPGNVPDIECFYRTFNAICEVTMLKTTTQWYNEGQPVMRHLRDFEERNPDKPAYGLFVAPEIHRDTVNTFFISTKFAYEGRPLKLVPLSIEQLVGIMETLLKLRVADQFFSNSELRRLLDAIVAVTDATDDSTVWLNTIPKVIEEWTDGLTS